MENSGKELLCFSFLALGYKIQRILIIKSLGKLPEKSLLYAVSVCSKLCGTVFSRQT
jgi:hypothetical protein